MNECIGERYWRKHSQAVGDEVTINGRHPSGMGYMEEVTVIPTAALREKIDRAKKDMVLAPRDIGLQLVHVINALKSLIPPEGPEAE